jgi:hypothetical protein
MLRRSNVSPEAAAAASAMPSHMAFMKTEDMPARRLVALITRTASR